MADKMLTAVKLESGNYRTPKGRILYPNLFKASLPKGETDQAKAKFGLSLLIPKGADMKAITEAVNEVLADNVTQKMRATTKVKMPFLKTEDQPRFAEFADDFPTMIRCGANYRPDVIGPTNRAIKEEDEADEVYGGRWARISVRPYFWKHPTGGNGISLGLQNVQLLDHDDQIAGGRVRAESEFESVGDELDDLENA